jgi:type IV pilus assembly protein PilC
MTEEGNGFKPEDGENVRLSWRQRLGKLNQPKQAEPSVDVPEAVPVADEPSPIEHSRLTVRRRLVVPPPEVSPPPESEIPDTPVPEKPSRFGRWRANLRYAVEQGQLGGEAVSETAGKTIGKWREKLQSQAPVLADPVPEPESPGSWRERLRFVKPQDEIESGVSEASASPVVEPAVSAPALGEPFIPSHPDESAVVSAAVSSPEAIGLPEAQEPPLMVTAPIPDVEVEGAVVERVLPRFESLAVEASLGVAEPEQPVELFAPDSESGSTEFVASPVGQEPSLLNFLVQDVPETETGAVLSATVLVEEVLPLEQPVRIAPPPEPPVLPTLKNAGSRLRPKREVKSLELPALAAERKTIAVEPLATATEAVEIAPVVTAGVGPGLTLELELPEVTSSAAPLDSLRPQEPFRGPKADSDAWPSLAAPATPEVSKSVSIGPESIRVNQPTRLGAAVDPSLPPPVVGASVVGRVVQTATVPVAAAQQAPVKPAASPPPASTPRPARAGRVAAKKAKRPRYYQVDSLELSVFTRQLATMIQSGITIHAALSFFGESGETGHLPLVVNEIANKVSSGSRLSEGFKSFPEVFSPVYVGLVETAEASSRLDETLSRLADLLENQNRLRQRLVSAITYPAFLMLASTAAIALFVYYILPMMGSLYQGLGIILPWPTRLLLHMRTILPAVVAVTSLGALSYWLMYQRLQAWLRKNTLVRRKLHRSILMIPVLGVMIEKMSISRVLYSFSTMLDAGLSFNEALRRCSAVAGNQVVSDRLDQSRVDLVDGHSIQECFSRNEVFPRACIQMLAVGEESASMNLMITYAAKYYESEVDCAIERFTALIEPTIMAGMGMFVGFIVLSAVLPTVRLIEAL